MNPNPEVIKGGKKKTDMSKKQVSFFSFALKEATMQINQKNQLEKSIFATHKKKGYFYPMKALINK